MLNSVSPMIKIAHGPHTNCLINMCWKNKWIHTTSKFPVLFLVIRLELLYVNFNCIFLIFTWGYFYWFQREREWERGGRGRERDITVTEKHQWAAFHICPNWGSPPKYTSWAGTEPTLWCTEDAPTNLATQPGQF